MKFLLYLILKCLKFLFIFEFTFVYRDRFSGKIFVSKIILPWYKHPIIHNFIHCKDYYLWLLVIFITGLNYYFWFYLILY
jgi:hypothetical protein